MNSTLITRRTVLRTAVGAASGIALSSFAQSGYPKGPLRIILGLAPGGAADAVVRTMSHGIESELGVPVIVDNRPGGQFVISMDALAAQPADGQTLLYIYNGYAAIQATQRLFDLDKSTVPLTRVGASLGVLLARGDSPFSSLRDMLGFARSNPGKLNYGTLGEGSIDHLKTMEILKTANVKATAVPYRTAPDTVKGLIGGEIDFLLTGAIFAKMYAPTKKVKVLAVLDPTRWAAFPDVPTLPEAGVNVAPLRYWGGYVARSGTSPEIVQRLSKMLGRVAQLPKVRERFEATGQQVDVEDDPERFRQQILSDVTWMSEANRLLHSQP